VCITRSTLMDGAAIKNGAYVNSSIVGWKSTVGDWVG
jgi:NDP-sugar pyrophosphorylase family protein